MQRQLPGKYQVSPALVDNIAIMGKTIRLRARDFYEMIVDSGSLKSRASNLIVLVEYFATIEK